jgi:hypothetical protein
MAKSTKDLDCFWCGKTVMATDARMHAVLCGDCVAKLSDAPIQPKPTVVVSVEEKKARKEARVEKKKAKLEAKKTAKKGRGRGWHLKQLFEFEGEFYSFGKKIGDAEVAKIRKALKKAGK